MSANPFSASFSHSRSRIEKSIGRSHNKGKSSRDCGSVQGSELKMEKILSEQRDLHNSLERKADQAFQGEWEHRHDYLKHSLTWTDENGRCRMMTELLMELAFGSNPQE